MDELSALVILNSMPYLGTARLKVLVKHFGSAVEAVNQDSESLRTVPGLNPKMFDCWQAYKQTSKCLADIELADKQHVKIVPFTSPVYPKRLLELPDHPVILYMKGELKNIDGSSIAIVGTRQASIYGLESAEKIAGELAGKGFTIVSGLARGIDTAAHQGALTQGRTIAIIGSGLANIYPKENDHLAKLIAEKGVVLSEFPMHTPPERHHFPKRNRLVSGMTLGTLLIEAPLKSGAMITMEQAWTQKKKLFSLPGRVDNENFKGNHALIKNGRACLIEGSDDIANCFESLFTAGPLQVPIRPMLETEEEWLINKLPNEECSIEHLLELTKLPVMKLNGLLMSLMLKRMIKEFPGKVYKKVGK